MHFLLISGSPVKGIAITPQKARGLENGIRPSPVKLCTRSQEMSRWDSRHLRVRRYERITLGRRSTRSTSCRVVRLCYYAVVRTTLDISDEAYYIAKAIARDQNRSLGRVVGDLILQSSKGAKGAAIEMSDYGFPVFRCTRPVTTEDVKALDDEE